MGYRTSTIYNRKYDPTFIYNRKYDPTFIYSRQYDPTVLYSHKYDPNLIYNTEKCYPQHTHKETVRTHTHTGKHTHTQVHTCFVMKRKETDCSHINGKTITAQQCEAAGSAPGGNHALRFDVSIVSYSEHRGSHSCSRARRGKPNNRAIKPTVRAGASSRLLTLKHYCTRPPCHYSHTPAASESPGVSVTSALGCSVKNILGYPPRCKIQPEMTSNRLFQNLA